MARQLRQGSTIELMHFPSKAKSQGRRRIHFNHFTPHFNHFTPPPPICIHVVISSAILGEKNRQGSLNINYCPRLKATGFKKKTSAKVVEERQV